MSKQEIQIGVLTFAFAMSFLLVDNPAQAICGAQPEVFNDKCCKEKAADSDCSGCWQFQALNDKGVMTNYYVNIGDHTTLRCVGTGLKGQKCAESIGVCANVNNLTVYDNRVLGSCVNATLKKYTGQIKACICGTKDCPKQY